MEYKLNEINASQKEVELSFPYAEIKNDIEKEVSKLTKKIQLPGFRKGKAPISVLKKMYGDAFDYDAAEKVANTKFWDAAKEKELKPIGQPQLMDLKYNSGEDLSFKVKFEVIPEIEVKDYTNQTIEIPILEVKDDDVNHEIEHLRKSNSFNEEADIVGDNKNFIINVELQRVDESGKPFENAKPETLDLDLSNPRIDSQIIENSKGKKVGDTFNFTFTEEQPVKENEGEQKTAEKYFYLADIKSIKKIVTPELNEEMIKKSSKTNAATEDELRSEIKNEIQTYYDQRTDDLIKNKLLQLVVDKNDFAPPETLVHNMLEDLVKNEEERYKKQGYKGSDKNEIEKRLHPVAELEVKWYIIKDAIQKKENMQVTDEDLQELVKKDAEKTGLPEEKLLAYYKSSNYNERLLDKKLFDFLIEKNTINKVQPKIKSKTEIEENK